MSTLRSDNSDSDEVFGITAFRGCHDVTSCMMPIGERKTRAGKRLTSTNGTDETRGTYKQNRQPFTDLQPTAKTTDLLGIPWMTSDPYRTHSLPTNDGNEDLLVTAGRQRQPTASDVTSCIVKVECDWPLHSTDDDVSTTAVDPRHDDDNIDVDDDYEQMWRPW